MAESTKGIHEMRRTHKIKKAVHRENETATKNKLHNKSYPKTVPLSSLIQIGSLLLLLAGNDYSDDWKQFDQLLRQFYDGGIL